MTHDQEREVLRAALQKIKIRLHFMGHPAEAMWNAGTAENPHWIEDWRYEIGVIENALHGSAITQPEKPTDTIPRHQWQAAKREPVVGRKVSDAEAIAWAERNDFQGSFVDLRAAIEDAQSIGTPAHPPEAKDADRYLVQVGWTKVYNNGDRGFFPVKEILPIDAKQAGWRAVFDDQTDTLNTKTTTPRGMI